jgi:MFS family permease
MFLGNFGLQMLSLAISWDLYQRTKSAVVLGNVGFAQVLPFLLFAFAAGHVADRYNRQRVLVATQFLLLGASSILAFTPGSVPLIYTCLFLTATARSFQGPVRLALIPASVPPEYLRSAITWNSSASEFANVSGPALAGVLLAVSGSKSVYIIQSGCALATLLCYWLMRTKQAPYEPPPIAPGKMTVFLEGAHFVWNNKLVLSAVSLDMFAVLFGGATALLPIYAVEVLHTDSRGLGWLRAAQPIGAVTMALLTAHRLKFENAGRAMLLAVAGFGLATVGFAVSTVFWFSFAMLVLTGAFDNISVVLRHGLVQTETPDRVRGRVLAVNNIFISCSNQLGAVESGWAAALMGTVPSVVFGGIATMAVAAIWTAWSKPLRNWRH